MLLKVLHLKMHLRISPEVERDGNDGESWICTVCGYIYNDPDVSFEELPDDWICPICGMPKKAFQRK